jgi:hypothetical protein
VSIPLLLAGIVGLVTATAALLLQGRRPIDRRFFAALITSAVTLSVFSVVAWIATAIGRVAPLLLIWAFVGVLALLFAVRLYRELRLPPPGEAS